MFKRKPKKKSELDLILDAWDECSDTCGEFSENEVRMFMMLNASNLYGALCRASARRSAEAEMNRRIQRLLSK